MRVVEVFGPTVQGEGPYAGRVCHFVRLGGCDYRCSWCDTPQAVLPELVREAEELTVHDVMGRLAALAVAPMVVLSGGNPALWHLDALVEELRERYHVVAVETQGSVWRDWLRHVDSLVVSPKPPSSGEATAAHGAAFMAFMRKSRGVPGRVLKVVVFGADDLEWAAALHAVYDGVPFYLSVGTGADDELADVGERYAWLCEAVAMRPSLHDAVVLPQLHVVAWGHAVGV